jgi:hypothetical protein
MSVDPALVTCQPAAPVPASEPTDGSVREQLLDALDFAYCQGLGYGTPEELVAAYDATLLPPTDQAALRDRIAAAIDGVFTRWQTGLGDQRPQDAIHDAVMAVLPAPADRAALVDLVDQLIEHCPDHGCVEPEWGDGCHCEIVPLLRRLADEERDEQQAQAHLDALAPIAEGMPLPDGDGPALYEKLVGMFGGPLPWPPVTQPVPVDSDEPATVLRRVLAAAGPVSGPGGAADETQAGFQDRGEAARQAAGIDGTAGDAQDVSHTFVLDEPTGGCLLCGLSPTYRKHTPAAVSQPDEEA